MTRAGLPASLVLVGAGKMGGALLEGWLADGLPGPRVAVVDPAVSPETARLCGTHGVRLNPPGLGAPEALVLAIKPQGLEGAAASVAALVTPATLVVSVLAGKTLADLKARLPGARAVVRAMPNLPASIRRGATGAAASPETTEAQRRVADALLSGVGLVEWLDSEDLIDAVTAVSGSGPAYVFLLAEALAEAGAAAGLPPEVAARLARQTVAGAGELLGRSPQEAATLRQNVTSPGGTTAAALGVLMAGDGLAPLMRAAVAAARRRAEELAG
ncbi:Pyrroline-5-carboxylate reductase [Methylobacterium crusticola]|uniref:Pyrroline-5-carboxylate reductase n=1 Tax=Methylobacterium crusticola TaxID=1697972 RepID=A0ABQ4R2T6_9HYPH|nr:pyrroline-5-carboxylate reductase [Methylobacterium crusticola]GJD51141.1 Pyrroline-5-carboxylate reductase [Methylobacterium crusticola]